MERAPGGIGRIKARHDCGRKVIDAKKAAAIPDARQGKWQASSYRREKRMEIRFDPRSVDKGRP